MWPKRPDPVHVDQEDWMDSVEPWRRYVESRAALYFATSGMVCAVVPGALPWPAALIVCGVYSALAYLALMRAVDSLWQLH